MINKKIVAFQNDKQLVIDPKRRIILDKLLGELNLSNINSFNKLFYGISGFPGAGKTTLARELKQLLRERGYNVILIEQDDFRIAKSERYMPNGLARCNNLPLINQWHNWMDMLNLMQLIKQSNGEQIFSILVYDKVSKDRTKDKLYHVRGTGDIVLVEGAFVFNVGDDNFYGVPSNALFNLFDRSLFVFRELSDEIDEKLVFRLIYEREKSQNPLLSDQKNFNRATKLFNDFIEDIKDGFSHWKKAGIYFDNKDLKNPTYQFQLRKKDS